MEREHPVSPPYTPSLTTCTLTKYTSSDGVCNGQVITRTSANHEIERPQLLNLARNCHQVDTSARAHAQTRTHKKTHTHTHTYTHTHAHTDTHARTHSHALTHSLTHSLAHVRTRIQRSSFSLLTLANEYKWIPRGQKGNTAKESQINEPVVQWFAVHLPDGESCSRDEPWPPINKQTNKQTNKQ